MVSYIIGQKLEGFTALPISRKKLAEKKPIDLNGDLPLSCSSMPSMSPENMIFKQIYGSHYAKFSTQATQAADRLLENNCHGSVP